MVIEPAEAHTIAPLKPGDGVVFDAADWRSPEEPEEGGRVFEVKAQGKTLDVRFANGAIHPNRIRRGDLVWRTHDPEIDKAARPYLEPGAPLRKQPVHVRAVARQGEPLVTEWRAGSVTVTVRSEAPLIAARNRGLDEEFLATQFGRLGNTPYELASIELETDGAVFAPSSAAEPDAPRRRRQAAGAPRQ